MGEVVFYGLGAYVFIVLVLEFIKHVNEETQR